MKKNLAFLSLALACLTAAPLASAATWKTWKYGYVETSNQPYTESAAWQKVNETNSYFCNHNVFAGKASSKDDQSACASAPRKVGNNWIVDIWVWYAR